MAADAGLLQPQLRVGLAIHFARLDKHMIGVEQSLGGQEGHQKSMGSPRFSSSKCTFSITRVSDIYMFDEKKQ